MLEDVVYLQTSFYVVVRRSYYVLAFHCSLSSTEGGRARFLDECHPSRYRVTRLVHIMILTVLVIVLFYFQLSSDLSLISMVCRMMCACVLHVSFIPMYNCVTMRIISLLSVMDLQTERVPDVCASANEKKSKTQYNITVYTTVFLKMNPRNRNMQKTYRKFEIKLLIQKRYALLVYTVYLLNC